MFALILNIEPKHPNPQITELLALWGGGDAVSFEQLVPLVEAELRQIARKHLYREKERRSLFTSDLINEAYLKLVNQRDAKWKNRSHFFAIASIIIRRILINHARDRKAGKRGAGAIVLNVDDVEVISTERSDELLALDSALDQLATYDPIKARIVELRYFGGMTAGETAEVLKLTTDAVNRNWKLARAWLAREIRR